MELRRYREGDREALARLGETAFGLERSCWQSYYDPGNNPRLDPDQVHVIEEDGEARATATVLPLEVYVDGRLRPMGGVAAVNAHPAYRRRGYAGQMMRAVLRDMRERGTHISILWPFAHAFYRAYGWELAGESIAYALKPTDLRTSPEQRNMRAYRDEDLPRLMELLEREAPRHQLSVRRSEDYWRRTLAREGRRVAVYDGGGEPEGYVLYGMTGLREGRRPPRALSAYELVARTPRAREALISFLAAQDPLVFEVELSAPRGEPLHPYLDGSHVEAKISPEFMLRLVDVEGALGMLDREVEEPLVLDVADDVIPENAGEYTLGDGGVVRGARARERASIDVRQLAQLYAGYLPARQLARYGLVRAGSEKALGLLAEYFPPADPWIYPLDHF